MSIEEDRRNVIKNLPDNFTLSDKETLDMINRLFEMVILNNKLINMQDKRIKLLEKSKQFFGTTPGCTSHRMCMPSSYDLA